MGKPQPPQWPEKNGMPRSIGPGYILRGDKFFRFPLRQSLAIEIGGGGGSIYSIQTPTPPTQWRELSRERKTKKLNAPQYTLTSSYRPYIIRQILAKFCLCRENPMFVLAHPEDSELIAWFDSYSNKYIAKGGNLAWRINNP